MSFDRDDLNSSVSKSSFMHTHTHTLLPDSNLYDFITTCSHYVNVRSYRLYGTVSEFLDFMNLRAIGASKYNSENIQRNLT